MDISINIQKYLNKIKIKIKTKLTPNIFCGTVWLLYQYESMNICNIFSQAVIQTRVVGTGPVVFSLFVTGQI